jgi:hypothetical protein
MSNEPNETSEPTLEEKPTTAGGFRPKPVPKRLLPPENKAIQPEEDK